MAITRKKTITLRAFKIKASKLSYSASKLRDLLKAKLEHSTTGDRRMLLSQAESEEDVLAYFSTPGNHVFGMMLRIANEGVSGQISPELFTKQIISIDEIASEANAETSVYKDHYYFLLNEDKIVVSMPLETTIKRLQTYLNWLLEDIREDCLFELLPMLSPEIPTTQLKELKSIQIGSSAQVSAVGDERTQIIHIKELTKNFLLSLIKDTDAVEEIMENNLVRVELTLHFPKKKQSDLRREDYERILGASISPISDLDGIRFETSKGVFISGEEVQCKERISVNRTEKGYVVEQELKQAMESFISRL